MQDPVPEHLRWKLLTSIFEWLHTWTPDADARELDRCGDDIRRIAADVGLDAGDLRALAPQGKDAAALLPHMMQALNLDPEATPGGVLRDLQRVCSLCKHKSECACELARGSADTTYADFCPNADTLRALQLAMQEWPSPPRHM